MNTKLKRLKITQARNLFYISLGFSLSLFSSYASAETFKASSSEHPVALIELYTSQGCSSCPPSEKWLGNLEKSGVGNDKAVPLALHIDYWDYIGWKDQFSQKYFKQRQYQFRQLNHSSSVYTPQIMFNGADVRRVSFDNSLSKLRQESAAVSFDLVAETTNDNKVSLKIDFDRIDDVAKDSNVIVVIAENDLVKDISRGENAGRTLEHHHVARLWKNLGKVQENYSLDLDIDPTWKLDNLEVVVIVETDDLQTQQALQLALN